MTRARCAECRITVEPGEPRVTRTVPAGSRAGLIHREITNVWHAECWAEVSRWVAEYEAKVKAEQRAVVRDLAAKFGLPDPYAGEE